LRGADGGVVSAVVELPPVLGAVLGGVDGGAGVADVIVHVYVVSADALPSRSLTATWNVYEPTARPL
jgi:hypothetical protein